jgi:hypothetical protein
MNHYGICHLSAVALRAEASSKSEMVSMLLFGEQFQILDARDGWLRIRTLWDDYESWLEGKQYDSIYEPELQQIQQSPLYVLNTISETIGTGDRQRHILLGSTLPLYHNGSFEMAHHTFTTAYGVMASEASVQNLITTGMRYLNAPYLWGGRSPFGIDCSGLTQMVYKMHGMALRRDAWQQAEQGETVDFIESARAGDLAFFDNEDGKITHVGLVMDNGYILHASGQVRIDRLDRSGIYNEVSGKYTHKLRIIKRIIHD